MTANELLDLLIEAEKYITETASMLRQYRGHLLTMYTDFDGVTQESYNKRAKMYSDENKIGTDLRDRIRAAIKQHQEDVTKAFMSEPIAGLNKSSPVVGFRIYEEEFTGAKSAGGRYVDCFDELKSIYEEKSKNKINHETNNLTQKQDEQSNISTKR